MSDPIVQRLFDFRGGIQNKRQNPLDVAPNTLVAGENVDLSDGALRTRPGYTIVSEGTLPSAEVMALSQVRFPSNETSFLVAQCADAGVPWEFPPSQNPPGGRILHYACYDADNNRVWVAFGRTPDDWPEPAMYNDLWYWDVTGREWYEVTGATNAPTFYAYDNDMVYDPVGHRLVLYVGTLFDSENNVIGHHEWWAYSLTENEWTQLTIDPEHYHGSWYQETRMVLVDRTLYKFAGWNGENFASVKIVETFNIDTYAYGSIFPTYEGSGPDDRAACSLAYDPVRNIIMMVGGRGVTTGTGFIDAWQLDLDLLTLTQVDSLPLDEAEGFTNGSLCYCSDKYFAIGTDGLSEPDSPNLSNVSWVFSAGEWSTVPYTGDPRARYYTKAFAVDYDVWLILGQAMGADTTELIQGAELLAEMCLYEPTGSTTVATTSRLWASPDHLPTSTMEFTEIYDLGDADRVSFAVLNDRVVITEGKAAPPLVWGGCMTDTGADWMYPKAVLVSQDGEHFYDVSAQVLDKDVDNVADIGLIGADGFVAVCTDTPLVSGFYFEMNQANSVETESTGNQRTYDLALSSDETVEVEDLKGVIANWVQDSGATGHFTDASNNPVTLGSGNDSPLIEAGLQVIFAATDATIVAITDDGEGTGEVELSATLSSQSVDSIVGIGAGSGALTFRSGFSPVVTTFNKTPGSGAADIGAFAGASARQVISASELSHDGEFMRITIRQGPQWTNYSEYQAFRWTKPSVYGSYHPVVNLDASQISGSDRLMLLHVSIGERDGTTANTVETPTPVSFAQRPSYKLFSPDYPVQDYPSYSVNDENGSIDMAVSSYGSDIDLTSNWIQYPIDHTKDYLLIWDGVDIRMMSSRLNRLRRSAGSGTYLAVTTGNPPETWNVADVTDYNFVEQSGFCYGLIQIEVKTRYPLPTQLIVATTATPFDTSGIERMRSVTANQTAVGSTHVYHAVSFDGKATFSVFLETAWRVIVRNSGAWQYLDGTDTWQNATTDTLLCALREAFAITENQMNATQLAAITVAQWADTGGFIAHQDTTLDFAVGMIASGNDAPVLTSYTIAYNDAGETAIQGFKGNTWTPGEGWTDNTRLDDVPWGQSGTITYDGEDPFEAQYHVLNEVPGYWFRFKSNGTAEGTSITRVLYKAPCQPLSNIGDGQPDIPLAVIFHDTSKDAKKDITIEVSGAQGSFTTDEEGVVTYTAGRATIPMETADYLYVGYPAKFNKIEVTPYADYENAADSTLSAEYWNGSVWTAIDIQDLSVGVDDDHLKTFSTTGKISWFLPSDWKMSIPSGLDVKRGFYMRFTVSANLTATTVLDEVRVYAVPDALVKHRYAVAFRDRIALVSRPDAPDQVDISRALEEYGFIGADSGSYRVGGMDSISSAWSAWNDLWLGKIETLHQLNGQSPQDFAWQGVEAASLLPINNRVLVKAPSSGFGSEGSRYSLLYINAKGAFVSSGFQVDNSFSSSRTNGISDGPNWWTYDANIVPRIDLNNLHIACGGYHAQRQWACFAVPMIVATGQTAQTTNNRIIVYDLSLGCWLPPFTMAVASMCEAYSYIAAAPGHIGPSGLYAGDYQGRILRLFDGMNDNGTDIACNPETGWLHFGAPDTQKSWRYLWLFGNFENDPTVTVYVDGNTTPAFAGSFSAMTDSSGLFALDARSLNVQGVFYKFVISWSGVGVLFGMQIELNHMRQWEGA